MADPTEPKKETVRIAAIPPPAPKPAEAGDTARITLPTRPPADGPLPPIGKPLIPSEPNKPVQGPRFAPPQVAPAQKSNGPISNMASPPPTDPASLGPKKETARVRVSPAPAPAAVQMKKTQPLIGMPPASAASSEVTPVTVAPETATITDKMPMALCWTLVGISAVILIIQILNYIS